MAGPGLSPRAPAASPFPMTNPPTDSKLRTLEEAAETIADGSTIAIGGLSMNSVPMAFIRTLARRKVRDLTVVAIVHGMPIEWLVAAGCVRSVVSGLVSLEGFGLAPRFRAAVQARRGRDRGVQRAHPDLPAPGRRLPDPVHADEGGARHRHARPPPRDDPRADRPRDRRASTSPARRSRSTSRSSTPRPPTRAATSASTRSSSGWTPSSSRRPRRRS